MNKMSQDKLKELAQPFFLKAEKKETNTLILLVHGFGASCTETRPLAEFLVREGYDCYGILLSGHGSSSKDLDKIKWTDWINDIKDAYDKYSKKYDKVIIGGVSLGGALSLYFGSLFHVDGIFTINAFYEFKPLHKIITPLLAIFKKHIPRSEQRIKWYIEHNLFSYSYDSTYGAYQILKFHRKLHKSIKRINNPVLLTQSQTDQTVNPKNAEKIYKKLQSKKKLVKIPQGDHILTVDENRELAFKEIIAFIRDIN
ncbi:MAG: alpha/beta hydrolase [Candidatus Heimdallarchaeaceae archaeon]